MSRSTIEHRLVMARTRVFDADDAVAARAEKRIRDCLRVLYGERGSGPETPRCVDCGAALTRGGKCPVKPHPRMRFDLADAATLMVRKGGAA